MVKIFISHSSNDNDYALKLAEEFRKSNFDVLLDKTEIEPGTDWQSEITQAVKSADTFVTLLSANSVARRDSLIELGMAWGLNKNIVPVVVPGQRLAEIELPLALQEVHVLDARQQTTADIAAFVGQVSKGIE
jgi:hypothetical protein